MHKVGKARTFQDYRNEKINKLEEAQTLLFDDVLTNISKVATSQYIPLN